MQYIALAAKILTEGVYGRTFDSAPQRYHYHRMNVPIDPVQITVAAGTDIPKEAVWNEETSFAIASTPTTGVTS